MMKPTMKPNPDDVARRLGVGCLLCRLLAALGAAASLSMIAAGAAPVPMATIALLASIVATMAGRQPAERAIVSRRDLTLGP